VKEELRGISGQDEYGDGMVEHDMHVGQLLALLDELGIADNTIVHYSTDNGPHMNTWPDAGSSPFFGEKNTNWEGGWRVPSMVRWPGKIEADSVSNEIMHHMDWFPTLLAAAGVPDIKEQLKKGGVRAIGRKFKVHLDGYNFLPHLTGETGEGPRHEIFYFAMFNLRRDPYERSYRTSNTYYDWVIDRVFFLVPAQEYVGKFLATFKEFPPRQKPASFSIDQVMEKMQQAGGSK
jgi:arylsulfatase